MTTRSTTRIRQPASAEAALLWCCWAFAILPSLLAWNALGRSSTEFPLLSRATSYFFQTLIIALSSHILLLRNRVNARRNMHLLGTIFVLNAALSLALGIRHAVAIPRFTQLLPVVVAAALMAHGRSISLGRTPLRVLLATVYFSLVLSLVRPSLALDGTARFLGESGQRLAGVTPQANGLAFIAAVALVFLGRRCGRWWLAHAAVVVVVLAETDSRKMWLAAVVAVLVVRLAPSGRAFPRWFRRVTSLAFVVGCLFPLISFVAARSDYRDASTYNGRTEIWTYAQSHWLDSPVFGQGPDVWKNLVAGGVLPPYAFHAHNQVFNDLMVGGLLMLIGTVALLGIVVRTAFSAWRQGDGRIAGFLVLLCVQGFLEVPLDFSRLSLNFVVALIFCCLLIATRATETGPACEQGDPEGGLPLVAAAANGDS